jgi:hypothetical protein
MNSPALKFIIAVFLLILANPLWAMNSTNYLIDWDSINSGGNDTSSSANYDIKDTLGGLATGKSSSSLYALQSGYRLPEGFETVLVFSVYAEDITTEIAVVNGGFENTNKQVTVTDATGYNVDDYIGVVENKGADQEVAAGKITQVIGNEITVDAWEGDNATMETIDGTNDYIYKMSTNVVPLGTLSLSAVKTGISLFEVSTNASDGYTVQFKEDHNLYMASDGPDIDDVGDGAVSVGAEEYGVELIGQDAQGSGDQAITSSAQNAALDPAEAMDRRTITSYKASRDSHTTAGYYAHTVTYTCTAAF